MLPGAYIAPAQQDDHSDGFRRHPKDDGEVNKHRMNFSYGYHGKFPFCFL